MIIIIGDSWGVSEWDKKCNLGGPGFGQYLMLHDQVINLSLGDGSNTQAITRLENLLNRFRTSVDDRIFWIVTCPSRCASMKYFLESDLGILATSRDLMHKSFSRMNAIIERHRIKIDIIGGYSDLCDEDISLYSNLHISVPSWCRLVDNKFPTSLINPTWWIDFGSEIRANRVDLLQEWTELSDSIIQKQKAMRKIFTTDGYHPDRHGHKILRDYFYPEFAYKY